MADAWQVLRAALRDLWSDLFTTAVVNLLWAILTLLVVTAPPAMLALFYVGNRIARGDPTDPGDFVRAFLRFFGAGWRWGAVQAVMLVLLVGDVILTGQLSSSSGARLAQGLYLAALVVWLLLQLYTLPFLFEQETPSVRLALRNGALMLGSHPGFSVALGLLVLFALVAGTLLFFVTLAAGGVFVALVGNHAVLNRLAAQRSTGEQGRG
jgi:hypothetical protein